MTDGDRVEVRCKMGGPRAPWKRGTFLGNPTDWIVQLDDGGHVHPLQVAEMRPPGIVDVHAADGSETAAQRNLFSGGNTVGSFWGGLAKLANPLSSPLSPIAQARRTYSAFRGGGRSAPPPSYAPPQLGPQFDPSQQYGQFDPSQQYGPAPFDPSTQQFAAPPYASMMYAPSPSADWSQYSSPSAGWPGGGFNPY